VTAIALEERSDRLRTWLAAHRELVVVYGALAILWVCASATSSLFLTPFNLESLMGASLALALVAIGQTFVVLTGGIDLSVGSTMSLVTLVAAIHMEGSNGRLATGILLALAIGAAIGLLNGLIVAVLNVQPIVATLGTLSIVEGLALWRSEVPAGKAAPGLKSAIYDGVGPIPRSVLVILAAFAIAAFVLRRTRYGMRVYALGGSEEATRLSGVGAARLKVSVYVICGLFAAAAGLALTGRLGTGDPVAGQFFLLTSVAAVAIGGTSLFGGRGGLAGTFAGVFVLTILNNILTLKGVGTYPQNVTTGLLIIAVVVLYSAAVRRRRSRSRAPRS
jgi:ribose transport system permease protein